MHCSSCRTDYREGVEVCSDCGGSLSQGPLPVTRQREGEDWVSLLRLRDEPKARIILGYLENLGIPCELLDKTLSEMPVPASTFSAYYEIWVPERVSGDAVDLLNQSGEGTRRCLRCGHLMPAEESRCNYCREPLGLQPS